MRARRRFLRTLGALGVSSWAGAYFARAHSAAKGANPMAEDSQAGWQLAEDSAEAYERYLVPAIFTEMAERLLEVAAVAKGERVLDVGCGTGIVARRAAERVGAGGAVSGLDLNEGMLRVARRVSQGSRIEWRHGDAMALPFPTARSTPSSASRRSSSSRTPGRRCARCGACPRPAGGWRWPSCGRSATRRRTGRSRQRWNGTQGRTRGP